ncbi:MAG: hypothetical protein LBF41_06270 [Deltaproteobacteria bacterium]|jgi:two-component system phosphate regulon sensor histidine kinase PhoR|nr:hypothetical protein [Deltaproteobacteria bacterium]
MISKHKIFVLIFLPAALCLMAGLGFIQEKNKSVSSEQFFSQLKSQWLLVSIVGEDSLSSPDFRNATGSLGLRVTLIDAGGTVTFDSGADEEKLEDHSQREEIRKAFLGVPSTAVRQSSSTGQHTIYYAAKLPSGKVLRVAYPADYFSHMENALITQTFSGIVVLIVAVGIFALLVSRKSAQTMRELSRAVTRAENGDSDLPSFDNAEMDGVLYALARTSKNLKESGEEIKTLNTRLSYMLEHIQEGVILLREDSILYKNPRAEEILNHPLPDTVSEIESAQILAVFESLSSHSPPSELNIGNRVVTVHLHSAGAAKLMILQDVSDRERYLGYKNDLVANISHELKTPLTLIITTSEVIVKDAGMPRDILAKFLKTILNNSKRLSMLLDDLISLHRLENAGTSDADSDAIVPEVMEDLRDLIDPKGKNIVYDFDDSRFRLNPCHVLSVLTNLISNAVKYSTEKEIDVSVKRLGGAVEIRVADGGPAIPPQERERIFERFYSMSESRNREQAGSGLGLSIVKHIAKIYRGEAKVVENARKGNTFVVKLMESKNNKDA